MALDEPLKLKGPLANQFGGVSEVVVFERVETARVAFERDSGTRVHIQGRPSGCTLHFVDMKLRNAF